MQGNTIRRLMNNGDFMYNEVCNYLVNLKNYQKIGNSNDYVSNEELVTTCKDYGNLYCVFDNIFLLSTTKGVT